MTEPKRALPEGELPAAAEEPRRIAGGTGFGHAALWTTLGTIIPGLGLLRAGRRVAGGVVLGLFVLLIGGLLYLTTGGMSRVASLATDPNVLNGAGVAMLVLALAWVIVIGSTHLAVRPPNPTTGQRVAGGLLVGLLSLAISAPLAVGAEYSWSAARLVGTIFGDDDEQPSTPAPGATSTPDAWGGKDRLNVLVLGGDSGTKRDPSLGMRADTVMVASIDTRTGVTTLFSLPRQTARVPFPKDSPLSKYYPNGFYDGVSGSNAEFFLNAMYDNVPARIPKDLLGPKVKNLGAEVMKVGVGEALGLGKLDYFVIVNMDGFKQFINAIGGLTLNVNYRIPIGGKTDEGVPPTGYIEPGPNKHLDGRLALWYARGRYHVQGSDYSRMERQRCVINAVVKQASPQVVLANFEKIAQAGERTIQTDIPRRLLPALIDLSAKVKGTNLHSVVFQPGVAGWNSGNPPWPAVRNRVQQALKEAADAEAPKGNNPSASASPTTASPRPKTSTSPKPKPSSSASTKADDLSDSCAYHPVK